jgi:hypothetical protein
MTKANLQLPHVTSVTACWTLLRQLKLLSHNTCIACAQDRAVGPGNSNTPNPSSVCQANTLPVAACDGNTHGPHGG